MSTFDYLTPAEAVTAAWVGAPDYNRITGLRGVDADRMPGLITRTKAGNARKPEAPWAARGHLDKFKEIARVVWAEDADPGTAEVFYADGSTDLIKREDLLCVERPITTADHKTPKVKPESLSEALAADGVTLTYTSRVTGHNRVFNGVITCEGRTMEHDWSQDAGNTDTDPSAVSILAPAIRFAQTAEAADDYEEWASDFAADPSDWMDRETFEKWLKIAQNLRTLLGNERYESYSSNNVEHDD